MSGNKSVQDVELDEPGLSLAECNWIRQVAECSIVTLRARIQGERKLFRSIRETGQGTVMVLSEVLLRILTPIA